MASNVLCEKFAESWFNGTHRVVGRKLKPFCLWHYVYLDFIQSPLSPGREENDGREIGWDDMEVAGRVCQLGYLEQLPVRQSWKQRQFAKLNLFLAMARKPLAGEIAAFGQYIRDYFAPPEFTSWNEGGDSRKRGQPPDPLSIASAVIMLFGGGVETEKLVWEMPIGRAYWYASTLHYNRGAPIDYVTARERAIRAFLRSQRAKGLI